MRLSTLATLALFGPLSGLCLCQSRDAQESIRPRAGEVAAYQLVLENIATADRVGSSDVSAPDKPVPQAAGSLTDAEFQAVRGVARDYESKNAVFLDRARPLRMDAVLESVDTGQVSEKLAKRIDDLQNEHDKMVLDQVQKLKTVVGDSRFEVLGALVRARYSEQPKTQPKERRDLDHVNSLLSVSQTLVIHS
jgi:hypothetical protein